MAEPITMTDENDAVEGAQFAAGRLAVMAEHCLSFYFVVAVLGYIAAAVLIVIGANNDSGSAVIASGIALAVVITASLLPMLLLCRWAQAYAVDLDMRASSRLGR